MDGNELKLTRAESLAALEAVLQRSPAFKRVKVSVCQGPQELRIFLESSTLPQKSKWLPVVRRSLSAAKVRSRYPIHVYGRQTDDLLPLWHQKLAPNVAGLAIKAAPKPSSIMDQWPTIWAAWRRGQLPPGIEHAYQNLRQQLSSLRKRLG